LGDCLRWAVFSITEEAQILGLYFSTVKVYVLILTKICRIAFWRLKRGDVGLEEVSDVATFS
jgi:hypothetical protein